MTQRKGRRAARLVYADIQKGIHAHDLAVPLQNIFQFRAYMKESEPPGVVEGAISYVGKSAVHCVAAVSVVFKERILVKRSGRFLMHGAFCLHFV